MTISLLPKFRSWCVFLIAALVVVSCGGGSATAPTPAPTPLPTPEPTPEPTPPVTSCSPLPPPITEVRVKIHSKDRHFWDIDATVLVGPDRDYCGSVGFVGRRMCPIRPEGDSMRLECELYAVGIAEDTGQPGLTWTRDGEFCLGQKTETECEPEPNNIFQLRIWKGGLIKACAENGVCGEVFADLKL